MPIEDRVAELLALPNDQQVPALTPLLASLPSPPEREAWNSAFGPGSLFDAWTSTSIARAIYTANAALLRPWLDGIGDDWRIVEIGGGDGRLWREVLRPDDHGELVVVDPMPDTHDRVRAALPPGVELTAIIAPVERADLPAADALVCSLTLHHVAGADAAERAAHGMAGPGKLEVLHAIRASLATRGGIGILNEADIYCDLGLASSTPSLRENLFDSYVRRCGRSLVDDLRTRDVSDDLRDRWRALLRRWFLEQVALAELPLVERDVYELDIGRWLALLARAGLTLRMQECTDGYGLFQQYVFEAG